MKKLIHIGVPDFQGPAPVLIGLLFSLTITSAAFWHLQSEQSFPDLVAGYVAYWGVDKSQDSRAFILLVALLVSLPLIVASVVRLVAPLGYRSSTGRAAHQLLLLSLIPAAWRLALDCALPFDVHPQFKVVCIFPIAAILALVLLSRYRKSLDPQQILTTGGAIVLIVFFSIFAGYALGLFFVRVIPATYPLLKKQGAALAWTCAIISLINTFILLARSVTMEEFQCGVLRWLRYLQYPLVLFFFHLVPPPFIDSQHRFTETYPVVLVASLSACVVISWLLIWRRSQTTASPALVAIHHHPLARAIAPAAVAALLIYVYCGTAPLPEMNADDFHWGEQALPWQQLVEFHKIPYVEFVPIHGFMSYIRGICSGLFFDGTAASYGASDIILMGLATAALAITTCRLVTPLGALLLLGGLLPNSDRMYFYVPALLAIAAPQMMSRPNRLLIVWLGIVVFMFGYNPTQGPAFAIATLPVALFIAGRSYRMRRVPILLLAAVVLSLLAVCVLYTPVRLMGLAFLAFVIENGRTNNVAHGIPWSLGRFIRFPWWGPGSTELLWELTRSFWLLFAFICAALFWHIHSRTKSLSGRVLSPRQYSFMILTGSIPLYLLLWSPWINGRLLPGGYAYAGDVSHTCMFWLAPPLVLLTVNLKRLAPTLLAMAVIGGFFYPSNPTDIDPDQMRDKCVIARVVPRNAQVTDGALIGMPRLGRVLTPPNFNYLLPIKKFLDGFLRPDETFLDLTNHTAIYYYLDLPYPVRYVPFVDANSRLQSGVLKQLDEHPVPAVLLAPCIMIDNVSPTLREYFVYRRYATTYSLFKAEAYAFLVEPHRGAALHPPAFPAGTDAQAEGVDAYTYFMEDLFRLPESWGHSWSTLHHLFSHVANLNPADMSFTHDLNVVDRVKLIATGPNPYFEFALPPEVASGEHADFLRINFYYDPTCKIGPGGQPPDPRLRVYFVTRSSGKYSKPFTLTAGNGQLLIPLGGYPRWLLAKDLITIRFDLLNPELTHSFRFKDMEFLHLNDPPAPSPSGLP